MLDSCVRVTEQRHQDFSSFFATVDGLCFWHNVNGLFDSIEISCIPNGWRIFIDSSSRSLNGVLLHYGNRCPAIPLAHSVHLQNYANVKTLLIVLKYDQFNWQVTGDFKMVAFLMSLQGEFTKCSCYLGHWDSRNAIAHYHRRIWSKRSQYFAGKSNIKWDPQIDPSKILMPRLHIQLALIKRFVKAVDKNSDAFKNLQNFFPKISEAKIKAGIFVGPPIERSWWTATNFLKN